MQEPKTDPQTCLAVELRAFRRIATSRNPRVVKLPDLRDAARHICADLDGVAAVRQAIRLAADRLDNPWRTIVLIVFALTPESAGKNVQDRRDLARTYYYEITGNRPVRNEHKARERFRQGDEDPLIHDVAGLLLELADEARNAPDTPRIETVNTLAVAESGIPATPSKADAAVPPVTPKRPQRFSRVRRLLYNAEAATLIGALVLVGAIWFDEASSSTPPSKSRVQLSQRLELATLLANAERDLVGSEAPEPGSLSSTLGYGDPTTDGRPTYEYDHPPDRPTLNALIDAPPIVDDERRFLHVTASPIADARQIDYPNERAVTARRGEVLWLRAEADNTVTPELPCAEGTLAAPVAENVHLSLSVWNAHDGRLHVVRAWLMATNTSPAWVTDAVAIVTTVPTTLEPSSDLSREFSLEVPQFASFPTIDVKELLSNSGFVVGDDGIIGGCYSYRLLIALIQQ